MKDKTLTLVYKPGRVEKVIRLYPGYYTFNKSATVTYTDGVTEAFSAEGELFSEPRLADALINSNAASVDQLLTSIDHLIQDFRNGEPPSDDLTMIAIKRIG